MLENNLIDAFPAKVVVLVLRAIRDDEYMDQIEYYVESDINGILC